MGVSIGDIIHERYRLLKKLGDGGMGEVFLAEDMQLSRQVALKTIKSELNNNAEVRQRIDRECKLHAALGVHPNIVALHDRIEDDKNIFLIMEYVPGVTSSTLIARKKAEEAALSVDNAVSIIRQLLEALTYIHDNDIIHRDIKPSNIILKETPKEYAAKLMDFGIALQDNDEQAMTRLTTLTTGGPGTPAYMAPERIDRETYGDVDAATDLYSTGIILYELLGGTPPFCGSMTEVFTAHLTKAPSFEELAQNAPPQLLAILKKALKKKKEERYNDARSFLRDLQRMDDQKDDKTILQTDNQTTDKTILATGREKVAFSQAMRDAKNSSDPHFRNNRKKTIVISAMTVVFLVAATTGSYYLLQGNQTAPKEEVITNQPEPADPSPVAQTLPPDSNSKTPQKYELEPIPPRKPETRAINTSGNKDQPIKTMDQPGISFRSTDSSSGGGDYLKNFRENRAKKLEKKTSGSQPSSSLQKRQTATKREPQNNRIAPPKPSHAKEWKVIVNETKKID